VTDGINRRRPHNVADFGLPTGIPFDLYIQPMRLIVR